WKQTLVSDFTIESISSILLNNNRGVGLDVDELAIWFKNFNRYNQGSEQEFWLANWNSNRIVVNRKTAKPINIPNPFVSVGGTIQPAVLDELAKNRTDNGFLDRLLFVMPENLKKQPWSAGQLPPETPAIWEGI